MAKANLYLDMIDFSGYFSDHECKKCGAQSCKDLVEKLGRGECHPADLELSREKTMAIELAINSGGVLPEVPQLQLPRPVPAGLVELNDPRPGDPVLVSGNSEFTQQVLMAVLSTTISPFFVLFSDTRGDTLDMAIILESFTPERIKASIESENLSEKAKTSSLVLPGLAKKLQDDIKAATGWPVELGPVCAAELPLYFKDRWLPSGD
jgi:CO dehydrogenase/acetyl-CoA synthase gamma subunit (corrinoid Fe-S protein)